MSESAKKRDTIKAKPNYHRNKKRKPDADAVVVVSEKEFHVCIYHLRSISGYFDSEVKRRLKKAPLNLKFEFPDEDPDEWELIMSIFNPFEDTCIDESNLEVVLHWFKKLSITVGLEPCDKALSAWVQKGFDWISVLDRSSKLMKVDRRKCLSYWHCWDSVSAEEDSASASEPEDSGSVLQYSESEEEHSEAEESDSNSEEEDDSESEVHWTKKLLDHFRTALQLGLDQSKRNCVQVLSSILEEAPSILDLDHWSGICSLMRDFAYCRIRLWDDFSKNLPTRVAGMMTQRELLNNALLPCLMYEKVQNREKERAMHSLSADMTEISDGLSNTAAKKRDKSKRIEEFQDLCEDLNETLGISTEDDNEDSNAMFRSVERNGDVHLFYVEIANEEEVEEEEEEEEDDDDDDDDEEEE